MTYFAREVYKFAIASNPFSGVFASCHRGSSVTLLDWAVGGSRVSGRSCRSRSRSDRAFINKVHRLYSSGRFVSSYSVHSKTMESHSPLNGLAEANGHVGKEKKNYDDASVTQATRFSKSKLEYERAVNELHCLMSNAETVAKSTKNRAERQLVIIPNMNRYIRRSGLSEKDVDDLSIIHVSGTKGKGSTCAFTERILHAKGFKTGLFSSPHLVEVRERFRINGRPISYDTFVKNFWKVYTKLRETQRTEEDMPAYFAFNVILSLHVFMGEAVDVIIMEVGIGGEYDSTNFIRHPAVCGVTSLGLDHTSILGNTLEEIAWNKAGIFKNGCPALTVPQSPSSLEVILNRAKDRQSSLNYVPELSIKLLEKRNFQLGIAGTGQIFNASLAVQLARMWETTRNKESLPCNVEAISTVEGIPVLEVKDLTDSEIEGLSTCVWPGRAQTIKRPGITYYLDGAHTRESMEVCCDWFSRKSKEEEKSFGGKVVRLLLFNVTGDRNITALLTTLKRLCTFDAAVFSTNTLSTVAAHNVADQAIKAVTKSDMMRRAESNKTHWDKICSMGVESSVADNNNSYGYSCQSDCIKGDGKVTHTSQAFSSFTTLNDKDIGNALPAKIGRYSVDSRAPALVHSSAESQTDLIRFISTSVVNKDSSANVSSLASPVSHHTVPSDNSCLNSNGGGLNITDKSKSRTDRQENGEGDGSHHISLSFPCVLHALTWATQKRDPGVKVRDPEVSLPPISESLSKADHIQVLITGSLHLVGAVLAVLEPGMND